jgi:hypothetical protein
VTLYMYYYTLYGIKLSEKQTIGTIAFCFLLCYTVAVSTERQSRMVGSSAEGLCFWAAAGRLCSAVAGRRLYIAKEWLLDMLEKEDFNAVCPKSRTHLSIPAQSEDVDYYVCRHEKTCPSVKNYSGACL